jgi:hypothetical protein
MLLSPNKAQINLIYYKMKDDLWCNLKISSFYEKWKKKEECTYRIWTYHITNFYILYIVMGIGNWQITRCEEARKVRTNSQGPAYVATGHVEYLFGGAQWTHALTSRYIVSFLLMRRHNWGQFFKLKRKFLF